MRGPNRAPGQAAVAPTTKERGVKVSIISYSFHGLQGAGQMDLFGYLESIRYRYGLDAADIWNETLASLDEGYLKKVKEGLAERELCLACLAVDGAHTWDPDPEARKALRKNALAHLRAAEFLGAKTVRIDVGGDKPEMSTEQLDWAVKCYKEYAQRAHDHGYMVGPENHYGPALVPENLERIRKAVDSPSYGVLLHLGRWAEGRQEEGDRLMAPWTFHTHVAWTDGGKCPEAGMLMLRQAGYQGYWGVEHGRGGNVEYAAAAVRLATVRNILERWHLEG